MMMRQYNREVLIRVPKCTVSSATVNGSMRPPTTEDPYWDVKIVVTIFQIPGTSPIGPNHPVRPVELVLVTTKSPRGMCVRSAPCRFDRP